MFIPSAIVAAAGATYALGAGASGGNAGYSEGNFGTLDPTTFEGETITSLLTNTAGTTQSIQFLGVILPSDFWFRITISGDFGAGQETQVWDVSDFTYSNPGGGSLWQFTGASGPGMVNGNNYRVTIS